MAGQTDPQVVVPTGEDLDKYRGYRITKWSADDGGKQYDNFECYYCRYKTLWIEKMMKHLDKGNHPWKYPDPSKDGQLSPYEETELEY